MVRHILATIFALALGQVLFAQQNIPEARLELYAVRDSIVYKDSIVVMEGYRVDPDYAGYNILNNMPEGIHVNMSPNVADAMQAQIAKNNVTYSDGFRVRIYLDNNKKSREESLEIEENFKKRYPQYNTYRSFSNPFFKVTVGDFRTKSDAKIALKSIARFYPSAFVVKEKIKFPIIDLSCSVRVDTLKVPADTLYITVND